MDNIASDQFLLLAAAATVIALLIGVLAIAVRLRKLNEKMWELDALTRSVERVESNLIEILQIADRPSQRLPELSGLGLHFRQVKREQARLSEKLATIASAVDALRELLRLRDETKNWRDGEIKEIAAASRALQEWTSRVTAVYSDAGHLFESEPIRELIDGFGPPAASHAVESPDRVERRTRSSSQKRVRPRRQR
jgi:hypothetical protein